MKKQTNWMDKPVTWRSYMKLSIICVAISTVLSCLYVVWLYWDAFLDFFRRIHAKVYSCIVKWRFRKEGA